jgi:4-amino-4-deoxy-L-arabinose transferase-like glycosyltransferase
MLTREYTAGMVSFGTQPRPMKETTTDRSAPRPWLPILIPVAIAVILSILASGFTRPPQLMFDEKYYVPLARGIVNGVYDDGYIVRTPLYPLVLAGLMRLLGTAFLPVLAVQALVRGLLVGIIAFMGARYASTAVGLIAGILLAFHPLLIWVYTRFLNETVYLPLFALSIFLIERALRSRRLSEMALAGLACGAASLARATSFYLTILFGVWLLVRRSSTGRLSRRNALEAAVLVAMLLAAVAPWAARNAAVHHAFMPLGNEASYNLWFIVSGVRLSEATAQWASWGGQAERQREALRRWWAYVRDNPGFHIKRFAGRLPRIFDPSEQRASMGLAHIVRGRGTQRHPVLGSIVGVLAPGVFMILLYGGLIGLAVLRWNPDFRALLALTVVYYIVLHAPTVMKARYFLPITCLLSIPAAGLIHLGLRRVGLTR